MTTATSNASVNTKTASRRDLAFATFDDLLAELDRVEAAVNAGTISTTGNWSPGQNMSHVSKLMRCAIDGFDGSAPAIVRFFAKLLYKKKALGPDPMPSGFKLPKQAAFMLPDEGISDLEGLKQLRDQAVRIKNGEQFTHPSPVFGALTHDQWAIIQLKHAAMHLSFLRYDDAR